MTNSIKQLTGRDEEEGFTLIELMVVVLIIGILMAIAIPTFLGAKNSANARAAQSNLRNAITTEQSYFTANNQAYGTTSQVSSLEPALTFVDTNVASGTIAPAVDSGSKVDIVALQNSTTPGSTPVIALGEVGSDGNVYYVYDANGQVQYYTQAKASAGTAPTAPAAGSTPAANSKGQWGAQW